MPNRLSAETSPYLLQHAANPVDWYPWGGEALLRARQEDKPIFLSIGYAACHWCHVMAHESFEDEAIARLLNEHFVCIKVDREERPDLDGIYMAAVVAMTGQGGWPMSVFLTPQCEPFYGGTYFPPDRRHGMPSFGEVLQGVLAAWHENRPEVGRVAHQLTAHLQDVNRWQPGEPRPMDPKTLHEALQTLLARYDWTHGGWGDAPKFPQPMTLEFLLQQASRGEKDALPVALHALRAMQRGGMDDVVGGGFHRYSTDAMWRVPHFEKMLYDNAQLARVYLHAYQLSGAPDLLQTCLSTLDFMRSELMHPDGGFYSSLDADSPEGEGSYYVWTVEEIRAALDDEDLFALAVAVYNLSSRGNFEGRWVLQRSAELEDLASALDMSAAELRQRLNEMHARLARARSERARPAVDDKVLLGWNALALHAFAEAGRALRRSDYIETAQRNAAFLLGALRLQGHLLRSWRAGQARHAACLEDYAALILALLALYQADWDGRWFETARQLAEEMVTVFADPAGGFYDTSQEQTHLLLRPKELQDNATPSGNALAALALLALGAYGVHNDERHGWRPAVEAMLATLQESVRRYPTAFAFWLQAMDFAVGPVRQVACVWPPDGAPREDELLGWLAASYRPRSVAAAAPYPLPAGGVFPDLLHDRPLVGGRLTVYVCTGFVCHRPVTELAELMGLMTAA